MSEGVGSLIPKIIEGMLDLEKIRSGHEAIDFGSALGFVSSLQTVSGQGVEEIGIAPEEIRLLEGALDFVPAGLAAIVDSAGSVLITVLDAVAALSCEAAGVDLAAAFDLPASGDGFSVKEEVDVAGDLKVLLFGSKFAGRFGAEFFTGIPAVHGSFRSAAKALHVRTRIELNSSVRLRKKDADHCSHGRETAFASLGLAICLAARAAGKISLARSKFIISVVRDQGKRSIVSKLFEDNCPGFDQLKNQCKLVSEKAGNEADDVEILHESHRLLLKLREILAWEAVLALFIIENDESFDKSRPELISNAETNGGDAKIDKKDDKKKKNKKKTLGRGTSVIRRRMISFINGAPDSSSDLCNYAKDLHVFFEPNSGSIDLLLKDVKEIIESNEIRRLPKIPKVLVVIMLFYCL